MMVVAPGILASIHCRLLSSVLAIISSNSSVFLNIGRLSLSICSTSSFSKLSKDIVLKENQPNTVLKIFAQQISEIKIIKLWHANMQNTCKTC